MAGTGARGAFVVSIDVELAWGIRHRPTPAGLEACVELERAIVTSLLEIFARHDAVATWAIVGHLLEPPAADDHLPGEPRAWYAPDVVDAIRRASPAHEIGSHGYAHLELASLDRAAAEHDLAEARRVHRAHGLPFDTFVFPRNAIGHVDALADVGLTVFRSLDAGLYTRLPTAPLRRIANLVEKALPTAPPVVAPKAGPKGLVDLPSSMLLIGRDGPRRLVRPETLVEKARRGMRRAIERDGIFHLWFHPSNFYSDTTTQLAVLDAILAEGARHRAAGDLDVLPMGAFAERPAAQRS